jgi:3-phenylpropionate/trans-cinnamate dioxygenase ferredoxin reductase subunit
VLGLNEPGVVIIGGGHAGAATAEALRKEGYEGAVTLLTEESYLPYQRPPLSKKYLAGALAPERLLIRGAEFYGRNGIEVRTNTRVVAIDRRARTVQLEGGENLPYHKLVLATGARIRPLPVPGVDLTGVHYLRSIADVDAIRGNLAVAKCIAIIGGGFIGLEAAAVLRGLDKQVTVVEATERLMGRVVAPVVSHTYRQVHENRGVRVLTERKTTRLEGSNGRLTQLWLDDGTVVECDVALIGIGVLPNCGLAQTAGLSCADGILVDLSMRTDDPDILACGDAASHENIHVGRRIRLESVQNANDQARTVAATIAGKPSSYSSIMWFWSDQYDLKLQMVGLSSGYDDYVLRGSVDELSFSVLYYRGDRLIAVDSINRPADHAAARKLLSAGASLPKEHAADPALPLKEAI